MTILASIDWTDSVGSASLANGRAFPGSRLRSWNPKNVPFGPTSNTLATGELNVTAFRDDLTVSFELPALPNTSMALMLRLQMHLKRGGTVTLTSDETIPTFGDLQLAPKADVIIQPADSRMKEYTLSTVLRGAGLGGTRPGWDGGSGGGPDCMGDAFGGGADYAFALYSEDNIVTFYNASGTLTATWDSGIPYTDGGIRSLCATRTGTVWAIYTPNSGNSTLYEIDPSDGSVLQTITASERLLESSATRRQVVELADGNLLVTHSGELWHVAIPSGTVSTVSDAGILGGDDLADTDLDFDINGAGTYLIVTKGTQLILVKISDGTRTTIKDFGYSIAWPKWLADCSILVETGNPQDTTPINTLFSVFGSPYPTAPTTGTYTLTFRGDTTTPIAWDATGNDVAAALEALASIGSGNVTASPFGAYTLPDNFVLGFQFIGTFAGTNVEAPTITDSTDGNLECGVGQEGGPQPPYGSGAGQYTMGDIVRVDMDGNIIRTYTYDRTPYESEGEGIYQFTASLADNKLWIHLEWDQAEGYDESSALEIINLATGASVDSIKPLILTDTDADVSAAAVSPYFARYAPA